jgi:hypothetical protein
VKGDGNAPRTAALDVVLDVALESDNASQNGSNSGKIGGVERQTQKRRNPEKPNVLRGQMKSGRLPTHDVTRNLWGQFSAADFP